MENNSIINAVKRVERAGSENSKVTEKLKVACIELGKFIEKQVPNDVKLPRDYIVRTFDSTYYLGKIDHDAKQEDVDWINGEPYAPARLITNKYNPPTRKICLEFAKDISEGLLDEIAEFLEDRIKKEEEAINIVENVIIKEGE
jgi:hypothetical protein